MVSTPASAPHALPRHLALPALVALLSLASACGVSKAGVPNELTDVSASMLVNSEYGPCYQLASDEIDCDTNGVNVVMPVSGATQLLAGSSSYQSTCGIFPDGTLQCATASFRPTLVAEHVAQASNDATCWITITHQAVCSVDSVTPPVTLDLGGSAPQQIVSTTDVVCVLLSDGTVECWNRPFTTATGAGQPVPGLKGVIQLSAGGFVGPGPYLCALLSSGGVQCWGSGSIPNADPVTLGRADATAAATTPAPVVMAGSHEALSGVLSIDSGAYTTCAVLSDHRVACWGITPSNDGQGPSGAEIIKSTQNVHSVAVGVGLDCALRSDGKIECWVDAQPPSYSSSGFSWNLCSGC